MGPRLNKRQQRELQELEELEKQRASEVVYASDDGEDETDHELETVGKAKPITSAFGAVSKVALMFWVMDDLLMLIAVCLA